MDLLGAIYAAFVLALTLHGLHRWAQVLRVVRFPTAPPVPPMPAELPFVTVQLPVFNERDVVARLVGAAAALDWPRDRLELQLLDDSTDDTAQAAAPAVARAREAGVAIEVIRRPTRAGFKAGALAHGLARARGELVAILDADFVPEPDLLRRLVPHFTDPAVGMVQARWGHLNARASWLTRAQARLLDAHFRVEHLGRHRAGLWMNFNGTAGVWRRRAIEAAGGWQGDTLCEDLDLSYRAQLAGWRFVYRDDVVVPAELPDTIPAFLAQQRRWARGTVQVLRKLGLRVLRAPAPVAQRVEALHHLGSHFAWFMAVFVSAVLPLWALSGAPAPAAVVALWVPSFLLVTGGHLAYLLAAPGPGRRDALLALALAPGLAVSQSAAALAGCFGGPAAFERTPKRGEGAGSYRPPARARVRPELVLAAWQAAGVLAAVLAGNLGAAGFMIWFGASLGWVGSGRGG